MKMEWTEDLSTAVTEIDNQHKELFKRVNCLIDACGEGKGRDEVGRMIGFLDDYVINHFSSEERYMLEEAYPRYEQHKQEHEDFIEQMGELRKKFHAEGGGIHVVLLTIRTAVEWLSRHIRKTDRVMAEYLRNRGGEGKS